jgi:pyruvate dehydrogenase phosphatase regulatory subunit
MLADISYFSRLPLMKFSFKTQIKIPKQSSNTDDVVAYLQKLCCNDVNIPIGTCIKTGMLNKRGGFENECIIVRLTDSSFFMVSPSSQQTRIYEWMENNLPSDGSSVKLSDQTSMYTGERKSSIYLIYDI